MIVKSFKLNDLKKTNLNFFLFYGENEGHKDELIQDCFTNGFTGEIIKYDENQILDNEEVFFETCLNDSLFDSDKIIQVSRVTSKLYETIKKIVEKKIHNKKIIFKSDKLDKKSKLRNLFEKDNNLVCVAFYQDNNTSLFKIASNFFKKNNILISSENINLVIDKCLGDRKNLQNEMNKILNFSFGKKRISRNELVKLINVYDDENFFELIDQCLIKNYKKVSSIINSHTFSKSDSIILIRSFLSRLKRLIALKSLQVKTGNIRETVDTFKPSIFWKDKEIVQKQVEIWEVDAILELLDKITKVEINYKKNSNLSNNLVFDLLLNSSNS